MTDAAEQMKDRLLQLPPQDRAELAHFLFDSLAPMPDDEWEQAWIAELDRRRATVESGEDPGIPAEEIFRRM